MTELTAEQIMSQDAIFWAVKNNIQLMGGTAFTLEGCEYMADIMRDPARHKAVMKGAQARITTLFMIEIIHAMIYGKYPQGGIYYFPKKEAVEGFSKTRFSPLIADNPCIRKHLKNTNSVSIKKVGKTFLSLLGASATSVIQEKKDGTGVRSTPADWVARDERDLFDDSMAEMTQDRLLNSKFQHERDLGTPTMPDFGIDAVFGYSDQKYRFIKCQGCNDYTCITDDFPHSIKFKRETKHDKYKPYFACVKCGKEIYPRDGEYVAKFPDRYNTDYPKEGISGFHVSHFITPNCDLSLVMDRYEKAQKDSTMLGLFYNKYLGLPHIDIEDRLRQQEVYSCCGDDIMRSTSVHGTAMAADIMKTNRVIIAEKKGDGKAKIIYMARVSGFDALYDLCVQFNVKSAVCCLRPYEESFYKFQARCSKKKIKVFGSAYATAKTKVMVRTDEESGIYTLHRTAAMDGSQRWIRSGDLELPRRCAEVEVFAKECCNTAKKLETDDKTGDRIYRYRPVGDKQEHYRHCVNYLQLALLNLHEYEYRAPVMAGAESEYDALTWGL